MGAKDYLVSSTLTGVIAQRLVRKLCDKCKEAYYPTEEEVKHIATNPDEQQQLMKTKLYRKKGCKDCGYLGYSGRLGIYEIMPITREIKRLIAQGAHDIEIEETAVAAGMKTLRISCLNHIIQGNTTVSEFIRVLGYANE
jgi:type IV pilus assembly protein PilB